MTSRKSNPTLEIENNSVRIRTKSSPHPAQLEPPQDDALLEALRLDFLDVQACDETIVWVEPLWRRGRRRLAWLVPGGREKEERTYNLTRVDGEVAHVDNLALEDDEHHALSEPTCT
jgi:hypothetical protein